ncbi:MAG: rod shape-determining protein MreC [Clostridia bacterium]|nr:rod shape-determining protein MreC [Clostridia bacterium]
MNRFFKSKSFKLFFVVIAALILGSVIASVVHSGNTPLSSALATLTHPLQKASTAVGNYINDYCDNFRSSADLQKQNEELKQKIADFQYELADYENTKRTLKIYEEFLGVKEENPDYIFENASVLSRDGVDIYGSFILDKGSAKGIEVNDPVIFGKNLVGIVTEVTLTNCTVKTLANPDVSVAVYEARSNETGYVTGFEEGIDTTVFKLPGLSKDSNIASGGVVYTTGIGGIYPKDLIVGTVEEIRKSQSDISYYGAVKSNVDFSELTEVFVITDFEGQGIGEVTEE